MYLLTRAVHAAVVVLVLIAGATTAIDAQAAPQAALVMDMRDGTVLFARSADRRLHPASLTKMMTLYLTFEAVRSGRLRLDRKVRVSRHASRQPASKLYLRAGQRVTVRSLIRAAAIKSANDAAMVLAETVGGSERRFARMMTAKARQLGMRNTAFRNPHGLTRRGHYSTARDMAILARHLFFDFPEYFNIFKRRTDRAAGRRIWTTNRLLSTYAGADGIKTGYTSAAGYNLVASAHRGTKRIIAVVFGARSSAVRARKVARLLDIGFARAARNVRRVGPRKTGPAGRAGGILVKASPLPPAKPGMRASVMAAVAEVLATPAGAATRGDAGVPIAHRVSTTTAASAASSGRTAPGARAVPASAAAPPPAPAAAPVASQSRSAPRVASLPVPRPENARGNLRRRAQARVPGAGPVDVPLPLPRPVRIAVR